MGLLIGGVERVSGDLLRGWVEWREWVERVSRQGGFIEDWLRRWLIEGV